MALAFVTGMAVVVAFIFAYSTSNASDDVESMEDKEDWFSHAQLNGVSLHNVD
jgi:hypothetical protein